MKNLLILLLICLSGYGYSQTIKPSDLVREYQDLLQNIDFISTDNNRKTAPNINKLSAYTILDIDMTKLTELRSNSPDAIAIKLPVNTSEFLELELVQVDIFSDDHTMIEEPSGRIVEMDRGTHYRGIIKGKENSLVSISMYENEIAGFVSHPKHQGNYVIGRMKVNEQKSTEHMVYLDSDLEFEKGKMCHTEDVEKDSTPDIEPNASSRALSDCVRLLLEVDFNMYQELGGTAAASNNYMTTLFNGISTIYAAESINTVLSQTYFWSSTSPYTGSSAQSKLSTYQSNRNNFNGDFAQLLTNINFGGLAADINSVCGSENNRMCVSGVLNQIQNVPTYSFDMEIACHEYGHLFGSFHTHGCYWNGNNTQIDDCASVLGNQEGASCYNSNNPILPNNGGTIMSYCYAVNGVGVNFANGFGPQPGNAIRNAVSNGSCLQDCGGNGGCSDNELSLTILTDQYPGETTWSVTSGGTTVASGGPYSSANSTFTESICVEDGCYTFTINDSYGDGICCAYGNGSYTLTGSDGTVIKSGGNFASSESTDFCEPSGGSSNCVEINFNDYSVVAYGNGQDNGTSSDVGNGAGRALFNNAWKSIALDYTVTSNTVIEFQFGSTTQGEIHGIGFDNNSGISSGFTFQLFGTQNWGNRDFDYTSIGNWQSFTIPVGSYYTGSFNRLFFVDDHDASPSNGNSYFRNIKIYEGGSCNNLVGDDSEISIATRDGNTAMVDGLPDEEGESVISVYPNPASDVINVNVGSMIEESSVLQVFNIMGQLVHQQKVNLIIGENVYSISTEDFPSGSYITKLNIGGRSVLEKISIIK